MLKMPIQLVGNTRKYSFKCNSESNFQDRNYRLLKFK
jgi:hypothetical protein